MDAISSFLYEAQTPDGQTLCGTLDAASIDLAAAQLQSLQLRVSRLEPVKKPFKSKPIRGQDFLAFNQQLAQLTSAGIPLERGLRLIASDLRSPRRAQAVNDIAAKLESGQTLEGAFDSHKGDFPPLYGQLLDAGVRVGNLPGILLSFGRHGEMVQRTRAAVWRAAAYPLMVLFSLLLVMVFIWFWIIPRMPPTQDISATFSYVSVKPRGHSLPVATLQMFAAGVSYAVMALIALTLAAVVVVTTIARTRGGGRRIEGFLLRIPLIGPILRCNLLASWCDALYLGVAAGLDLPASIGIAINAVDSKKLRVDSERLRDAVTAGRPMDELTGYRLLPAIVPASLQLGAEQNDLPATAAALAKMYQEQSSVRIAVLPAALSPILLFLVAGCVAMAVVSAVLPLIQVLRVMTDLH